MTATLRDRQDALVRDIVRVLGLEYVAGDDVVVGDGLSRICISPDQFDQMKILIAHYTESLNSDEETI